MPPHRGNPGPRSPMPTPMSLFRRLFSVLAVLAVTASVPAPAVAGGAAADHPGPLVSAAWLKARLADPDLVIVDIRSALDGGGQEAYLKAHIPGAVHSDYDKARSEEHTSELQSR